MQNSRIEWESLANRLQGDSRLSLKIFDEILNIRYAEPHRAYHTLGHIEKCLLEFETLFVRTLSETDLDIGRLALWFHDVEYYPERHDNEEASAALMTEKCLEAGFEYSVVRPAQYIIQLTVHAELTPGEEEKLSPAARAVLDVDMSILAQDADVYDEYRAGIRREYSVYPDALYMAARIEFIQKLLKRRCIFYSDIGKEKYGTRAHENLQRELRLIRP